MSLEIKSISPQETLPLRQRVLKPFATLQECAYDEDSKSSTFHYGLFVDKKLQAIATFIQESHPEFNYQHSYRLRGMAVNHELQGQGLGQQLLHYGISALQEKGCDFLWFNAREVAFTFYKKLGCIEHGPLFEIPRIGPHKVMYKKLNSR